MKKLILLGASLLHGFCVFAQKQLYQVRTGDNLSRIAQNFGMSVSEIKELNQMSSDGIREGQKIWVNAKKNPLKHTVQGGESLYKIASQYQISVEQLKTWNQLPDEQISVGQQLWLSSPQLSSSQNTTEKNTPEEKSTKENTKTQTIREVGMGASIPPTDSDAKLALHATAPVGTFIQVYNDSQRKSVSVKVIGKLSPADINRQVLIKLSKAACRALGVVNAEFPVVLVYEKKLEK